MDGWIDRLAMSGQYSTVQLKLVVKTKFPFISPTCFTQIPLRGFFCETVFSHFPPFSLMWGEINFTVCEFCFTIGETQWGNTIHQFSRISPNFPPISPEFPRNSPIFPEFPLNFTNSPRISTEFPPISQ